MKKLSRQNRLIVQMRVAAANIAIPEMRRIAAREAVLIGPTRAELMHTVNGEMLLLGRSLLKSLAAARPEQFAELADTLRSCAAVVAAGPAVAISETRLGQKRRRAA